jgi:hypothetical protein
MNFSVGTFHQNRNGYYEIIALNGSTASIRYKDGSQASSSVSVLKRIEENLLQETGRGENQRASEEWHRWSDEWHRMQFEEAREYLKSVGISFDPEDKIGVFRAVNEHKESLRLILLHKDFLDRKGISVNERSLVAVAGEIQKARRTPSCYSCRSTLDNLVNLECSACRWIMCPQCGACGCGYTK